MEEFFQNQSTRHTMSADIDELYLKTSWCLADAQTFLITEQGNVREPYIRLHTSFAMLFANTRNFGDMVKPKYQNLIENAEEWLDVSLRVPNHKIAIRNLRIGCKRVSNFQQALVQAGVVVLRRE
jgi:hypothetical protein